MKELGGYMGKVLKINLTTKSFSQYPWRLEDKRNYLGGKSMAIKMIIDLVPIETKSLHEENVIVISTGPLTLTGAPASNRFNISSISPLNNQIVSSTCGGNFGLMLKRSGIDALIITGKANQPTWIEIDEFTIHFHDATHLWGLSTSKTQEELEKSIHQGQLVIGPAGEKLVEYAEVYSQDRSTGRSGMGAIFGSKHLKTITVVGKKSPIIASIDQFNKFNTNWIKSLSKEVNSEDVSFENIDKISIEEQKELTYTGCVTCPINCRRILSYQGKMVKEKELTKLISFGSYDLKQMMNLKIIADDAGIDLMSFLDTIKKGISLKQLIKDIDLGKVYNEKKEIKHKIPDEATFLKESISSIGICVFTKGKQLNKLSLPHLKALELVTGMKITYKQFIELSEVSYQLETDYNKKRLGIE